MFRVISGVLNKPETNLYIDCVGGVGCAGTIVACYYIYFMGMSAEDIRDMVEPMHGCSDREKEEIAIKLLEELNHRKKQV